MSCSHGITSPLKRLKINLTLPYMPARQKSWEFMPKGALPLKTPPLSHDVMPPHQSELYFFWRLHESGAKPVRPA